MNVQSDIKAVAVTGTPGCGKTTLCQSLPFNFVSVEDLAIKHGCISPADEDGARPIDVERLAKIWQKPNEITLIDGHLSHLLPVDAIIDLRCDPDILRDRLNQRGYSKNKVEENVEFELMGGVWSDLIDESRPIKENGEEITEWITSGCPPLTTAFTAIDWISAIE